MFYDLPLEQLTPKIPTPFWGYYSPLPGWAECWGPG
jgi:hypothetical protein